MLRFLISTFLILGPIQAFAAEVGVGRGGGGFKDEKILRQRFKDVLNRVENLNLTLKNSEVSNLVVAIRNTLKEKPLKVEFVDVLRYCDTDKVISEKKDAWGCPGRMQIFPTFDGDDDAMIFHELTRITPQYEMADEGMRLSVDVLSLNTKEQKYAVSYERFLKNKYSRKYVEKEAQIRERAGAEAVSIKEDEYKYTLKTFWQVLQNGPTVDSRIEFER